MNKLPYLYKKQTETLLKWAEKMIDYNNEKWNKVVFSSEKKWNLDDPDGSNYYWHGIHKEPETYFSRQSSGYVIIWGAFCANGISDITFLDGKQNSKKYIEMLSKMQCKKISFFS